MKHKDKIELDRKLNKINEDIKEINERLDKFDRDYKIFLGHNRRLRDAIEKKLSDRITELEKKIK